MFYGWPLLAVLCVIYLLGIGPQFYGFGVVLPRMAEDMGWTRAEASLGYSLFVLSLGLVGPLVAVSIRRLGTRLTFMIGGLLTAAGAILAAFSNSVIQYYIGAGIIMGIGVAMLTIIPGTTLVTNWFLRRRSLAMAIFLTAGGLGGFIAAPAFQALMSATGTWRYPWYVMAGAGLVGGVLGLIFARERPEQMGQYPDGVAPSAAGPSETTVSEQKPARVFQTRHEWQVGAALRTPTFWLIVLAGCAFGVGLNIVTSQSVAYLGDVGIPATVAASALGLVAIISTVGRLVTGGLGDRIEPRYLLAVGLLGEIIGILVLMVARSPLLVYVFVVVFGLGYGIAYVCIPALIGNYFGRQAYPSLYGIRTPISTAVGALGPILAGLAFDMTGSYATAFIGFAIFAGLGLVAAIMARPPQPATAPALGEVGELGLATEE